MMHCAHLIAHGYLGIGSHKALIPPAVVPAMAPHIAIDTLLGLTINAKYSKSVKGPFGIQMIGKGNDSGYVVPHFCIPPPNVLLVAIIPFGGSKVMFSAAKVQMDVDGSATPVAAACFPVVPISLNQACNDPCNYPSDIVVAPNSVVVGMTLADILGGVFSIAVDCGISALANWIGGEVGERLVRAVAAPICRRMSSEFVSQMADRFGREAAESMGRDVVENMLERPLVQATQELVGKTTETIIGNLAGDPGQSLAEGAGSSAADAIEGPSASSSSSGSGAQGSQGDSITGSDGSNPRVHTAE
jgi:hypothetical protein